MTIAPPKLTAKQYLKLHPEKYVMVTHEFGNPIYIAPIKGLSGIQVTDKKEEAEVWSAMDYTPVKLGYHKAVSGYKGLNWEQI